MAVLADQVAVDAINRMKNTLAGGLADALNTFRTDGDTLTPDVLDGPSANTFREEWATCKQKLSEAETALQGITDNVLTLATEILQAGGANP
jgi:hypothetical protein